MHYAAVEMPGSDEPRKPKLQPTSVRLSPQIADFYKFAAWKLQQEKQAGNELAAWKVNKKEDGAGTMMRAVLEEAAQKHPLWNEFLREQQAAETPATEPPKRRKR